MDDPTILSVDTVLRKTKANSLTEVRNINLWGCKLANLQVLKQMPAVEIISLSVNNISTLADFACCSNLKELYLRKNAISDLNEVLFLKDLPNLKVLWLCDNPITQLEHYRAFVVRCCPRLSKLDNNDLTAEEVEAAQQQFPDLAQLPSSLPMVASAAGASSPGKPRLQRRELQRGAWFLMLRHQMLRHHRWRPCHLHQRQSGRMWSRQFSFCLMSWITQG